MGVRSLSFSLSLPPRMCVRAYVRASMYVCSAASPPHPPPTLVFAASSFPLLTPNSITTSASPAARPSPVACTCQTHLLIRLLSVIGPNFVSSLSIRAITKLGSPPSLPSSPRCVLPPALPFSDQRNRDSGSLGGSLTFVCAPILHRPPHWSSTGPCCRAGPPVRV